MALDGVSLDISPGIFGLLGPNGAGKTTLMRILATLLDPTAGGVFMDDVDIRKCGHKLRSLLGYLPQKFQAYPSLKVEEFLDYAAVTRGMTNKKERREATESVLETTGLVDVRRRRIKKLSGGMHRRVGVAQAMLGPPDLLIVDEPTVGLDPEERIRFRRELSQIGADRIVILSTHIVGDISSSCERMAILDAGTIVFDGSPSSFIEKAAAGTWEFMTDEEHLDGIKKEHRVVRTAVMQDGLRVRVVGDKPEVEGAESVPPTLEDAYVHFMGDRLDADADIDVAEVAGR
jgi:ABC-2 type transport system ATP-binding protein